jgi:hypothetical protein
MHESKKLVNLVTDQVKKKFGKNVTLSNILEILALAMKSAETWRKETLSGDEKKLLVMEVVRTVIIRYADSKEKDAILEYVNMFGGMGVELIIWLSQNPEVMKAINSTSCSSVFTCCRK